MDSDTPTPGVPTLDVERELFSRGQGETRAIVAVDEVGRGAIAGPVSVGAVYFAAATLNVPMPEGLKDSKLLSEKRRTELAPLCAEWVPIHAVGNASPEEIERLGITASLALAGKRALNVLLLSVPLRDSVILLDGKHDWLGPEIGQRIPVVTRVKADRDCASVAAASVLAKVERDGRMRELATDFPQYAWQQNKGYGSAAHYAGIDEFGVSEHHRASWIRRPG